jgi:ATP-dependent Clp protease, protease subunit
MPAPERPYEPESPTAPPPGRGPLDLAQLSIFNRLYDRRIVFLRGPLEGDKADEVAAQLLGLDADADEPVQLYIDSPGGDTFGMFAIHDTMQLMRSPVHTTCVGLAASAGAFLLATGTGTRAATPNARVMLHQPLGGGRGSAVDIEILAAQFTELRARMERILAERTGQPLERIHRDLDRDFWLSAEDARAYGIIDEVVSRRPGFAPLPP